MTERGIRWTQLPIIETADLVLRRMSQADAEDLFLMRHDPRMIEHVDMKLDQTIDETKAYIDKMNKGVDEQQWLIWAMEHRRSHRVVGSISLWNIQWDQASAEFGYGVMPEYQGQGLMKQALLKVIDYAFNALGFKTLYAYTERQNTSSVKLLKRCGFVFSHSIEEKGYFSDRVFQMAVYKLEPPSPHHHTSHGDVMPA